MGIMTGSSSHHDAVTEREAKIIKHIENYFSDVNLLSDKFLQEKIKEDDGWVTTDTMLKFKRLSKITDDAQMICEALKKSSSGLMEVSEQGDKIRRSPSKPLPDSTKKRRKRIITRTVCAKSFPLDVKLDDLMKFLEGYGRVYKIWFIKRRFQNVFKKWVFATFSNKYEAAKLVSDAEIKFKEQALKVKFVKPYYYYPKAAQNKTKVKKDTGRKQYKKGEERTGRKSDGRRNKVVPDGKRKHDEMEDSSDGEEQDTEEPPAKVIKSEMIITGPQGKRKHKRKNASSDGEEQDTEEPPAKVIRSEMFIKFNEVMKLHDAMSDGEEQDIKEPPAKVIKSDMIIKFNEVMKLHDALSDGEDQDTKEPPAKHSKSELIIKFTEVWKLHDGSSSGEEQDTKEPLVKVSKSEMMITDHRSKGNNRKDAQSDKEEQDTEETKQGHQFRDDE